MSILICTHCEKRIETSRVVRDMECSCGHGNFIMMPQGTTRGLVKQSWDEYMSERYPHIFGVKHDKDKR